MVRRTDHRLEFILGRPHAAVRLAGQRSHRRGGQGPRHRMGVHSLQPAIGRWLQIDFDRPVTNAALTLIPSATAVGAQVRRIQVSTGDGTTTVSFDQSGEPLTIALPYGETSGCGSPRWVPTTGPQAFSSASPICR